LDFNDNNNTAQTSGLPYRIRSSPEHVDRSERAAYGSQGVFSPRKSQVVLHRRHHLFSDSRLFRVIGVVSCHPWLVACHCSFKFKALKCCNLNGLQSFVLWHEAGTGYTPSWMEGPYSQRPHTCSTDRRMES
ncbi:unnamed protein product, partial [Polarella glacialis]